MPVALSVKTSSEYVVNIRREKERNLTQSYDKTLILTENSTIN